MTTAKKEREKNKLTEWCAKSELFCFSAKKNKTNLNQQKKKHQIYCI